MNKIYLSKNNGMEHHAGSKARNDAETILEKKGYRKLTTALDIKYGLIRRPINYIRYNVLLNFPYDTIVFNQYPDFTETFYSILKAKKKKFKFKIITLVHDLAMRTEGTKANNTRLQDMVFEFSDILIVHNESMKKKLTKDGISKKKMLCLEIFDYISDDIGNLPESNERNEIIIAGNLDSNKCGYIRNLCKVNGNIRFNLYGPNYSFDENDKINYFGSFPPDILLPQLHGGWGLIWDGPAISTCGDLMGEYLQINNPHKVSLYIAAKKPIIIWKQAALAEFVIKRGIGITINSLDEIADRISMITDNEYKKILKNIVKEGIKIRKGSYLNETIQEAERMIHEKKIQH